MAETNHEALSLQIVCLITILVGFLSLLRHQKFSKQSPALVNLATDINASMIAFVPLLLGAALSFWSHHFFIQVLITAAGVLAVLLQAKWQPNEASFLSHRRYRILGFGLLLLGSAGTLSFMGPQSSAAIPLLFAMVVYGRHMIYFERYISCLLLDLDGMTQKNLKLESNFNTLAKVQQSRGDKFRSAS